MDKPTLLEKRLRYKIEIFIETKGNHAVVKCSDLKQELLDIFNECLTFYKDRMENRIHVHDYPKIHAYLYEFNNIAYGIIAVYDKFKDEWDYGMKENNNG